MNIKKCTKCGIEQDLSDFNIDKRSRDSRSCVCKICSRIYANNYNKRDYVISRRRDYCRKYQQGDDFKFKRRLVMKEFRKNHPHNSWAQGTIRCHKKEGLIVSIPLTILTNLAKTVNACFICGKELRWTQGNGAGKLTGNSPTLDRIDNGKELNISNTQIICHTCNTTKHNLTMSEFASYCKMVADKFYKEQTK
jgi:hypothetical protein